MSEAPTPMGEDTGTPDIQAEGQEVTQEQPATDDYQSRIDQRLEEMSRAQREQFEEFRQWRETLMQPEEDEDDYSLEEGDEGYEEQEAQRAFEQAVAERVRQELEPERLQRANDRRDNAYENLKGRLPEFQKDDVARKYITAAVQKLEDLNPGAIEDQRLIEYIELMYKADKADERAAQETPPQRTPSLESGGGAAPQDTEEDLQDRMIRQLSQGGGW